MQTDILDFKLLPAHEVGQYNRSALRFLREAVIAAGRYKGVSLNVVDDPEFKQSREVSSLTSRFIIVRGNLTQPDANKRIAKITVRLNVTTPHIIISGEYLDKKAIAVATSQLSRKNSTGTAQGNESGSTDLFCVSREFGSSFLPRSQWGQLHARLIEGIRNSPQFQSILANG